MLAIKSRLFHVAVFLLLAFVPMVYAVKPAHLYIILGAVLCTTSVSVVHAYWPSLRQAFALSVDKLGFVDYLTMGIMLIFTFTAMREGYVTYAQIFDPLDQGRPPEFYLPLAFARYGAIVSAYMALSSRHFILGPDFMNRIPGWPRAVLSLVIGVAIGVVLTYLYTPPMNIIT